MYLNIYKYERSLMNVSDYLEYSTTCCMVGLLATKLAFPPGLLEIQQEWKRRKNRWI